MPARPPIAAVAVAVAAALPAACGEPRGARGDGPPAVVATTTQLADLARTVGGGRARVRGILGPAADPHDYEPRPSDARAVAEADVVLRSGGELDAWLDGLLAGAGSDARTLTVLDAVAGGGRAGRRDPHWWQDPRLAGRAVAAIAAALAAADPSGRAGYARRAAALRARLRALDGAIAACMAAIPERRRRLVTAHDALGRYAARYGIEVVGTVLPARTTRAQASARHVARLAREIRAAGVRTIFPQRAANPRLVRAIAREAGVAVGPPLYADALGPAGSPGATYAGALRFNTRALAAGFGGRPSPCRL